MREHTPSRLTTVRCVCLSPRTLANALFVEQSNSALKCVFLVRFLPPFADFFLSQLCKLLGCDLMGISATTSLEKTFTGDKEKVVTQLREVAVRSFPSLIFLSLAD